MDLSKLIHGFLNSCYIGLSKLIDCYMDLKKNVTWICQNCYMDFFKLLHGFVKIDTWISLSF